MFFGNESRNPDWDCKCGAMGCFGSKSTCYKCGALNPNGGGSPRVTFIHHTREPSYTETCQIQQEYFLV
jgi:hypothetical protein